MVKPCLQRYCRNALSKYLLHHGHVHVRLRACCHYVDCAGVLVDVSAQCFNYGRYLRSAPGLAIARSDQHIRLGVSPVPPPMRSRTYEHHGHPHPAYSFCIFNRFSCIDSAAFLHRGTRVLRVFRCGYQWRVAAHSAPFVPLARVLVQI